MFRKLLKVNDNLQRVHELAFQSIQLDANNNASSSVNLMQIKKTTLGFANFNAELDEVHEVIDKGTGEVRTDIFAAKNDDGNLTTVKGAVTYENDDGTGNKAILQYEAADNFSPGELKIVGENNEGDKLEVVSPANTNAGEIDRLSTIDTLRSEISVVQSRFEYAIANLSTNDTYPSAARSRIEYVGYATEVAKMTRAQILQQVGTSVLRPTRFRRTFFLCWVNPRLSLDRAFALSLSSKAKPALLGAGFLGVNVSKNVQTISAYNVINDVIPKLSAVETLVEATIKDIIETSRLPAEIDRYSKLQMEFQLELTMIRMNLEHLLKRYHKELEGVMNDPHQDVQLPLDQHESVAVESARMLYQRVQELQTQGVS